jgi:hypothetical protein
LNVLLRTALLLAGAALLLAGRTSVVSAQDGSGAVDAATLRERLDPAIRDAVQGIIDSSVAAGVPFHPLAAKALEGAAKRAPGDRSWPQFGRWRRSRLREPGWAPVRMKGAWLRPSAC